MTTAGLARTMLPRGPVMLDIAGTELAAEERERLGHPLVGGVILFARNYVSREQLVALTRDIEAIRSPALLVAVDHEGGRVQRFRDGFTAIPAMRELGQAWDRDVALAAREGRRWGWHLASELRACGVDFSFTPVLDIDYGRSAVIGNRAFHRNPNAVAHLAAALHAGLAAGGMPGVGKHFPGHGYAEADSHTDLPVDERTLEELVIDDLVPFGVLCRCGIEGIMPAHVVYPKVDAQPAGFSRVWLQDILRGRLGFDGVIFSDDLGMAGARVAGGMVDRAQAAVSAGCDVVLVCNDPDGAGQLLDAWRTPVAPTLAARWERMAGRAVKSCPP